MQTTCVIKHMMNLKRKTKSYTQDLKKAYILFSDDNEKSLAVVG